MIDLEPAIRILRNDPFLHGFTHTYLGATLVALVSVALGSSDLSVAARSLEARP